VLHRGWGWAPLETEGALVLHACPRSSALHAIVPASFVFRGLYELYIYFCPVEKVSVSLAQGTRKNLFANSKERNYGGRNAPSCRLSPPVCRTLSCACTSMSMEYPELGQRISSSTDSRMSLKSLAHLLCLQKQKSAQRYIPQSIRAYRAHTPSSIQPAATASAPPAPRTRTPPRLATPRSQTVRACPVTECTPQMMMPFSPPRARPALTASSPPVVAAHRARTVAGEQSSSPRTPQAAQAGANAMRKWTSTTDT
jgi:hypothetical protein